MISSIFSVDFVRTQSYQAYYDLGVYWTRVGCNGECGAVEEYHMRIDE